MAKTEAKSHVDYQRIVELTAEGAVDPPLLGMPPGNNALSRMAQSFALARMLYNKAEKLYNVQRAAIIAKARVPGETGTHVLCDTPQVMLSAQVTEPVRRLNEQAVAELLAERLDIDMEDAMQLVDTCRVAGDPVVKLSVVLKK